MRILASSFAFVALVGPVALAACSSSDGSDSFAIKTHKPAGTTPGTNGATGTDGSSNGGGGTGSTGGAATGGGTAGSGGGTAGNGGGTAGNGGTGGTTSFTPATHPALPVMVSSGGPVMATPKAIPVFFPNDTLQTSITQFVSTLGATDYWKANTSEYGVGALTSGQAVTLNQAAPSSTTDSGIQTIINNAISSGALPQPDASTLYTLFFPASTTITLGQDASCQTFGGYHEEGKTAAGKSYVYAVIPRCSNFNNLNGIDMVTVATSHEYVEAATDPLVNTAPAFQAPDDDHAIWGAVFTSESGDMCAQNPNVEVKPTGFNFTVQKSWSNAAGKASHDPCAPNMPGQVYFNSAPDLSDSIQMTAYGQTITTKGVAIPTGQSKTIDLALYSDGPTSGPWTVQVIDLSAQQNQGQAYLDMTLDKSQGQNGDHLKLTITAHQNDATLGVAPFLVVSKLGTQESYWVGAVKAQ